MFHCKLSSGAGKPLNYNLSFTSCDRLGGTYFPGIAKVGIGCSVHTWRWKEWGRKRGTGKGREVEGAHYNSVIYTVDSYEQATLETSTTRHVLILRFQGAMHTELPGYRAGLTSGPGS
jgi:hypothetical protein